MILLIRLQTISNSKLFLVIALFIFVAAICPLVTKSVSALDIDNNSKQSNSLQDVPFNSTIEFTKLTVFGNFISDKISKAVSDLEISGQNETLQDVPFLMNVSSEFNGLPANLELV